MLCVHHVQWVVPVAYGLHRCIQCGAIVGKKDVTPRFDDLGPEFARRWDEHERSGAAAGAQPRAPGG